MFGLKEGGYKMNRSLGFGLVAIAMMFLSSCGAGIGYPSSPSGSGGLTDGAKELSVSGPYTVSFSEPVDTSTVTDDTLYMVVEGGAAQIAAMKAFGLLFM